MRSHQIKQGIERAPHRALLKATGVTDADMGKPFIAIVNSYIDIVPGHVHLQAFGKLIKDAVRAAGVFYLDLFYNLVAFSATAQTGIRSLTTRTRRIMTIRERAALACINV